jgi:hypothetical protein
VSLESIQPISTCRLASTTINRRYLSLGPWPDIRLLSGRSPRGAPVDVIVPALAWLIIDARSNVSIASPIVVIS